MPASAALKLKSTLAFLALQMASALGAASARGGNEQRFVYELSVAGLGAAEFHVVSQFNGSSFRVDVYGQTYGAVDLIESLIVRAFSTGQVGAGDVTPTAFGTDNTLNGDQRRTRVSWRGSEGLAVEVVPSLLDEQRSLIPDDARMGAVDPISALMRFALGPPSQGSCAGSVKVFDGRRSYTLALDADEGQGTTEDLEIGDDTVPTLKCRITSMRTGGKSPEGWLASSPSEEHAEIWFWRDAAGRAIPVRLEADGPIGYGVAQLTQLP